MAEDRFDVIVVGAGVAGSTAAACLAQKGLDVLLVERGPYPGSKNLSGGILYGSVLRQLVPDFWETAPVERRITNFATTFLTPDSHLHIDFKSSKLDHEPYNAVTVLRARFDRWLADVAEQAGAVLVTGIKVDRLVKRDGRVAGVMAGEEEILADVVIAADGANSFIAQDAGLIERVEPDQVGLGVKEVISLPESVINERFHLIDGQGAAYSIVGSATEGIPGGGFLYTNRDSLSLGLVMKVDDLVREKRKPAEILENFKQHPWVSAMIAGGTLLEYGAHLVPEGGLERMPRLYDHGLLLVGDAAGLSVNNGFVVRGMDLAIGSAMIAAEAILEAREVRDFSREGLAVYQNKLDRSFVMADMRTYARTPQFFEKQSLFETYPALIEEIMLNIYRHDGSPRKHLTSMATQVVKEKHLSVLELARDFLDGARAL